MDLDDWPDCPVEGCDNKICIGLDSSLCFPHTPGNKWIKWWKIDAWRAGQARHYFTDADAWQ